MRQVSMVRGAARVLLLAFCSRAGLGQHAAGLGRHVAAADELRRVGAAALVMDVAGGQVLYSAGDLQRASAPGSILKPLVLLTALRAQTISEHNTVPCTGSLRIAGHNLACSHPRDFAVMDARQALASSCNTYFSALARRMPTTTLVGGLQSFNLPAKLFPMSGDQRALLALGVTGMTVTPTQMAEAYRKLALQMLRGSRGEGLVIREGMVQSVESGMANAARGTGLILGGKTGTVDNAGARSHGWFAGVVFAGPNGGASEQVIVVFVPNGNGSDAARLARVVLQERAR